MRYLSVCSGIEAASVAWHPLGWTPVAFSEIEPFPAAVLKYRFPNVPNYGDMTKHKEWPLGPGSIDLFVGGTPCQSFSVAGLRKGLSDPRGGLMLTYLEIAQRLRPRWVVWENAPGVLSSGGGRDFGSFLGALGELGYGWAYRVLDAQWCRTHGHSRAVPQRRRRVFVVGCLGDGTAAAEVLFESQSVRRNNQAQRETREEAPSDAGAGTSDGCYWNGEQVAAALTRKGCDDRMPDKERLFAVLQPVPFRKAKRAQSATDDETWVEAQQANTLNGFDTGERDTHAVAHAFYSTDGTHGVNQHPEVSPAVKVGSGLGIPSPPAVAFTTGNLARGAGPSPSAEVFPTLKSGGGRGTDDQWPSVMHAVAHALRGEGFDASEDGTGRGTPLVAAPTITSTNDPSRSPQSAEITQQVAAVHASTMTVRRLTAKECERLQGFPDDWTLIPWRGKPADQCPDGPRYKALGNSMAVNCMAWIGERIAAVEAHHAG